MVVIMVCNPQTYVEDLYNFVVNCLLKKAMGLPYCIRITPIVVPEASVSRMKGTKKSGAVKTNAWVMTIFNWMKAARASDD